MSAAKCEIDGCHEPASVHVLGTAQRVCSACARDLADCERPINTSRFPRAAIMLEATAIAGVLRAAAIELEELAGSAPAYEVGTLRRKVRAVVLGALAFAEGSAELDGAAVTRHLAAAELHLRIVRETAHATAAMASLARARPSDRIRRGGRADNAIARHWRRAKRHLARAAQARAMLARLGAS